MFSGLSLKYRIAIIIFCLEAVMMATVLQQTLGESFEASSKQILSNEHAILNLISGMSKSALITEEYAELQPYIVHLISDTEVTKFLLTDAYKTVVISSSTTDIGHQLPDLKNLKDRRWQTIDITNAAGLLGVLSIEFSNEALNVAYIKARDFGIGIALIGMLIIAFIGVLVGFLLTRRLENITNTAQRLVHGDYSARTNIHGKDEIGKLASTFNEMVQGLLESKDELSNALDTLKEKEQHLAITLNSIGDAVISTDEKGNVIRMNPVAENLTGWSFQEAQGQSLKTIFPIVDASTRETITNPVDKVLATGEIIYLSNHTTLISKNGKEYQIADSAAPIRNNGHILGMVLVFNDVTEQYQMRQELNDRSTLLKKITDRVPGMVYQFVLSKDGSMSFPYMGDAVNELYHISHEEVLEDVNRVFSLTHPDDVEMLNNSILESARNFTPWKLEYRIRDKDGRVRWLYGDSIPEKMSNGDILWHGFVTDITDKKEKEDQLRRSQKMDALGKLTGGVAHDYNNMLGVILGYSELIEGLVHEQPKLTNYIHEIQHAGERGAKLTKKLLTFSRQESSEDKTVNLNSLLQDSQLMLEKTMTVRIKLVFDLKKNLWPINLDVSDLEDAILNMSINAMHAIDGNGQITFETRNELINKTDAQQLHMAAGEYVLFSVTDTGCGMDSETKERIFEPFYSTKGELGTGLGLSQVYGLVQRSKGNIKIYSEPGHGSRFTLYFPRCYESELEEKQFEEGEITNLSGNQTILVVDDEPALVKLSSHILSEQGYHVFSANSGEEALLILEKEHIDLLLSDVIMPEMDGYQLAAVVVEKYPNIKIQLASGFSDDRHVDNINLSLHHNILQKPYHSKTLLLRIHELINGSPD